MQICLCKSTSEEKAIQNGGYDKCNPLYSIWVRLFQPLKMILKKRFLHREGHVFNITIHNKIMFRVV